ncbi:MAG: transglutaminase domain-containing protein [Lachnospiraceae bacterium]|nr:transglutaminase domain-containing protein [Lachnospiraceae bacterium]
MEPYYYSQLNKQQQKIYQEIRRGLESLADSFEVSRVEGPELSDLFFRLRLDCPEIFYAANYKYSYFPNSNVIQMKPEYLFDKNKIREHQKAMKARVEKLTREIREKSDWEKELYIHDFICENVTYDKLKKQYSHEILGPLGQGVGVCEGIAKAVKVLCDALELPCIVVVSENNLEKGMKYRHAWNVVKVQGKWYHMDATFDNTLGKEETRYDYFNLPEKAIFRDHEPLICRAPECLDEERFYYREKKLSFTKQEDVKKRCQQAIRKDRTLTFHWRGGHLTRAVLEELLQIFAAAAGEKERHSIVSVNWPQAVIRVRFPKEQPQDRITMENAYAEENPD